MKIPERRRNFLILLIIAFTFRLGFGLCTPFWSYDDDQRQIYLLGLKFYITGEWPYFGPDVSYPATIQIPGALQGLLVGLPLFILPIPEAPFLLLNILTFSSLCFLAWYCAKRLPELPTWFVWSWLLTAPWTLNVSTHIYNLSYVLPGSILFFVGALETYPFLSKNLIPPKWANFMMGFSLFWVMQLHLSWIILLPYLLVSFYFQYRTRGESILTPIAWFAFGSTLTGSLLVPTFLRYGLAEGLGGINSATGFNPGNLLQAYNLPEGILGRFLSFASFEILRFIGNHTAARMAFLRREPWLIPFVAFLVVVGVLQPIAMLILWFSKNYPQKDWKAIKYLTLLTVCLLYIIFLFAFSGPNSHKLYITLPIAMIYSLYCWSRYLDKRGWQTFAKICIICGIIFHIGLAVDNLFRTSLYVNRNAPKAAINGKDYRLFDERRPGARY